LLATLTLRWLQGQPMPKSSTVALAAALLCTSLAVLLPSVPFRAGRFEFYTLSWFHLYVVGCTCTWLVLLSWLRTERTTILALSALGALLLVPLLGEMRHATSFLTGDIGILNLILEMHSPVQMAFTGFEKFVTKFYSLLIWIAPITFLLCVVQCWRERREPRLLFWISSVAGLALLSLQLRLHYFGAFALYLPWLILAQTITLKSESAGRLMPLTATLILLLAYIPQIRYALIEQTPRGGDEWFDELHPILPALSKACAEDPGIVLADNNAGHYIRYYSRCAVIANNFLLTPQHFEKVTEMNRLFSLSPPEALRQQAPYVKYVLVRAAAINPGRNEQYSYSFFGNDDPRLARTLLLSPVRDLPAHFKMLDAVNIKMRSGTVVPYARLFKVDQAASQPSLNDVTK
jgi:hypothetical protein